MTRDDELRAANEALNRVAATFLGSRTKTKTRAKPHRCLGCGRVTRHVFCPKTYDACRALYRERTER
jgi:hypothetical protein